MKIEAYRFGKIQIDGKTYSSDVLVWPGGVDDSWWRREGHDLCLQDLEKLLARELDALVIGTGANGVMKVRDEVLQQIKRSVPRVHVARTDEACRKFNELAEQQDVKAGAALHLTC